MSIKLKLVNGGDNSSITTEVEENESVGDLLVFAAQYWNKDNYAFVMKIGNKLIPANKAVGDLGLSNGDEVTIVPDPQGG